MPHQSRAACSPTAGRSPSGHPAPSVEADATLDGLARLAARALGVSRSLILVDQGGALEISGAAGVADRSAAAAWLRRLEAPFSTPAAEIVIEDVRAAADLPEGAAEAEGGRALLGMPLLTPAAECFGTFWVMAEQPRHWSAEDREALRELASAAAARLRLGSPDRETATAEPRYPQLVALTRAIPWEADLQTGRYTRVGEQAEALLGYPEEAWYRPDFRAAHLVPEDPAWTLEELRLAGPREFEYRMSAADGRIVWFRDTLLPVDEDAPGKRCGFLFEISEQKQTELALRQNHTILEAVSEGIADAMFVKDLDGRYLMINAAGAGFLGRPVQEIIGRHDSELFTADTVEAVLENDRLVLTTGQTYTREERLTAAGTTRTYLTIKSPFRDASGRVVGMMGVSRDISDRKAAEEALRESEARFRTICEVAPIGIALADPAGHRTYNNAACLKQLGLNSEEARGVGWLRALHPADRERVQAKWSSAAQTGEPFQSTHRFIHPDGTVVWSEVQATPIWGDRLLGFVAVLVDITQRMQEAAALREQKELLQTILDHIPAMVSVFDAAGQVVFTNREWERRLGWTLEESCTVDILAQLYPDPDYRRSVVEFIQQAQSVWADFRTLTRSGHILDTSWANVRLSNDWCIGIGKDDTQRKLVEERDKVFQSLGQLLNNATTPTEAGRVVLEVAHRLFGWDACWLELTDRDQREVLTSLHLVLVGGEYVEAAPPADNVPHLLTRRTRREGPLLLRQPAADAGREGAVPASTLCVPIRGGENVIGALCIQSYTATAYTDEDLAVLAALAAYCGGALERTQAEAERESLHQQLLQAQKMEAVGRLAGGIAHDFNNMLAVINGYSDLLLSNTRAEGPLRQGLREIHRAGSRAAELTHQLLAFSRKQLLEPRVLNLNQVVRNTERMLQRLIGEDVELTTDLDPALGEVKADPSQLDQILMNLAVNARDAMPLGGKLTIRTRNVELDASYTRRHAEVPPGHYVRLSITDTGCGMAPEILARIWEPFFTTKSVGEGTGLGLAMIYGIVKQSGGHVEVKSAPGEGSTFYLYLPRLNAAPVPESAEAGTPLPPASETVLVVEDEEMVRNLVRNILQMQGYTVLEARNGEQGVEVSARYQGPIHLLLTDVVMPGGMSGRLLANAVSAQRPEIKILFMSGYTDDAMVRHGVQHADIEFIPKPFTPAALGQKIRDLLHPD